MKIFKTEWLLAAGLVALGTAGIVSSNAGCGSSNATPDGGTGTAGSGAGTTGTGGTGTAGTTGTGGAAVTPRISYTFDTATSSDSMLWKLSDYPDGYPSKNLGAYANADAGLNLAAGTMPTIAWATDDSASSATSGSMKITATFTAYDQYVDPNINLAAPVDLSGSHSLLKVKIRLVSGSLGTGGFQVHVSSGLSGPNAYVYVSATWVNATSLTPGSWITTTLDTSTLSSSTGVFDSTQIVQMGIQFSTGSAVDGGTPPSTPVVLEIDTIQG